MTPAEMDRCFEVWQTVFCGRYAQEGYVPSAEAAADAAVAAVVSSSRAVPRWYHEELALASQELIAGLQNPYDRMAVERAPEWVLVRRAQRAAHFGRLILEAR